MRKLLLIIFLLDIMANIAYADGVINVAISTSSDDAEEWYNHTPASVTLTNTSLTMGDDGADQWLVGLRFNNINIPQGASIGTAYIQFESAASLSGSVPITITGQLNANPTTFLAANYNISTRLLSSTTAQAFWSPGAWGTDEIGPAEQSADISGIVEELVALPSWMEGNSIVIIFDGTAGPGYRLPYAVDGTGAAPALYIEWCDNECIENIISGDEFLNIQDIFSLFLGRWIIVFVAAALAGTVARTLISILWRRPQTVRIVRGDDDD